jgi:hypothetical protein
MYQKEIERDLVPVTNREQYQIICLKLKKLMRIDKERVKKLIKSLKVSYGRRRALVEELEKIS